MLFQTPHPRPNPAAARLSRRLRPCRGQGGPAGRVLRQVALLGALLAGVCAGAAEPREAWLLQQLRADQQPLVRQSPDEAALKLKKMAAAPLAFFRGSARLFYRDMQTLAPSAFLNEATRRTWLVGDAHMENFGAWRDAGGNVVFGVNDFDESGWGPWIWDVRRMAVGILLAGRQQRLGSAEQQNMVAVFLDAYLDQLRAFRGNAGELGFRLGQSNTRGAVRQTVLKAMSGSRAELLRKHTTGDGEFERLAGVQAVGPAVLAGLREAMAGYVQSIAPLKRHSSSFYTLKDAVQRLGAGLGSLGRPRYHLLIEGPSPSPEDDVLLVMKQAGPSAVALAQPGAMPASVYSGNEALRIVRGMQAGLVQPDPLLGVTSFNGQAYVLREKQPQEQDFDLDLLGQPALFSEAVGHMGQALAGVHALADRDHNASWISTEIEQEIDQLVGTQRAALRAETLAFALDYAAQVELDTQALQALLKRNALP